MENNQICTIFEIKCDYNFFCLIFAKVFILDLNHSKMYLKYQRLFELLQNACRGEGPIQKSINESSKKRHENIIERTALWAWLENDHPLQHSFVWLQPELAVEMRCILCCDVSLLQPAHLAQGPFLPKNQKEDYKNGNPWLDWQLGDKVSQ